MQSNQASSDLLAHFDRPKTDDLPDFEWDEAEILTGPPDRPDDWFNPSTSSDASLFSELPVARRGIPWVLGWTAAIAVVAVSVGAMTQFAYLVAAEHSLARAARAGATEATLPRATYQSVMAAIERRLISYPNLNDQLNVTITQNGSLVHQPYIHQTSGDEFSVALSASKNAAVPAWLRRLPIWYDDGRIRVHAEQKLPGRKLPRPKRNQAAAE